MFCSKCGNSIETGAVFCSACGARVGASVIHQASDTTLHIKDISWGSVAANFVGMLLIAYLTYPIPEELSGPDAPIYLLLRVGVPSVFGAIIVGMFYVFRRKTERHLLMRSFIIASWVFLGLVILGENSS